MIASLVSAAVICTPPWVEWAKALGVPLLAIAVSFASYRSGRWQVRIAREKLRHDLYDRRYAIYAAFHDLLVVVTENHDLEAELRKANAARAQSPFLLNAQIGAYLERLHKEAFRINAENKLVRDQNLWSPEERVQKALKLGSEKLALANRVPELVQNFECLRLTDLSN